MGTDGDSRTGDSNTGESDGDGASRIGTDRLPVEVVVVLRAALARYRGFASTSYPGCRLRFESGLYELSAERFPQCRESWHYNAFVSEGRRQLPAPAGRRSNSRMQFQQHRTQHLTSRSFHPRDLSSPQEAAGSGKFAVKATSVPDSLTGALSPEPVY